LPVRSKEFSRNIRKEYGKLISLLNVSVFWCLFSLHFITFVSIRFSVLDTRVLIELQRNAMWCAYETEYSNSAIWWCLLIIHLN
jgi:hypothetical protein